MQLRQDGVQVLGREQIRRRVEERLVPAVVVAAQQLLQRGQLCVQLRRVRLQAQLARPGKVAFPAGVRDKGIALVKTRV